MILTPRFLEKLFFCSIGKSNRTKFRFLIILFDKLVLSSVSGIWIKYNRPTKLKFRKPVFNA